MMTTEPNARRGRWSAAVSRLPLARRRHRRLDERAWLLIGVIMFGLEIVLAVVLVQAIV